MRQRNEPLRMGKTPFLLCNGALRVSLKGVGGRQSPASRWNIQKAASVPMR